MTPDELKKRMKQFALNVIKLVGTLPRTIPAIIISKQLVSCATSTGANYRSACRAKSRADFVAKMGIVEEEADETVYWLEMLVDSEIVKSISVKGLIAEANEFTAIASASRKTARRNG